MHRLILVAGLVASVSAPAMAQTWAPWYQPSLLDKPSRSAPSAVAPKPQGKKATAAAAARAPKPASSGLFAPVSLFSSDDEDDDDRPQRAPSRPITAPVVAVADGGPRPDIAPQPPSEVEYQTSQPAGTVVIDNAARRLYLVQGGGRALMYPVSVGREGFRWAGTERISRVADWPDWHPPAEMRERDPRLPLKMTGGVRNPLGAKALYLGSSLYRIHGTSDARSIGQAASSGCFRMHNRHVVDLARRVGVGTKVVVINASSGTRTASSR